MLEVDKELTNASFKSLTKDIVDFLNKNQIKDQDYIHFITSQKFGIYKENSFSVYEPQDMYLLCILGSSNEMCYDLIKYNEELMQNKDFIAIGLTLGDNLIAFKRKTNDVYFIDIETKETKKIANSFKDFLELIN